MGSPSNTSTESVPRPVGTSTAVCVPKVVTAAMPDTTAGGPVAAAARGTTPRGMLSVGGPTTSTSKLRVHVRHAMSSSETASSRTISST